MSNTYQDLVNTNFPDSNDTYKIYQDVNADNITYVEQIQADITAHNFDNAKSILSAHPELNNVIATASLFQRYEDQIIAIQRTWKSTILNTITQIINYQGDYSATATYKMFNLVNYDFRTYMCISDTPITNIIPTNTTYWKLQDIKGQSGTGMSFYTNWDSNTTYKVEDCVPYGNKLYVSVVDNNTNHIPSDATSSDYWKQIIVVPRQTVWSKTQPENQEQYDIWNEINDTDNSYVIHECQGNNSYLTRYPKSNANFILDTNGNTVQSHISNTSNPHNTTAAQVGAVNKIGDTMSGNLNIANTAAAVNLNGSNTITLIENNSGSNYSYGGTISYTDKDGKNTQLLIGGSFGDLTILVAPSGGTTTQYMVFKGLTHTTAQTTYLGDNVIELVTG